MTEIKFAPGAGESDRGLARRERVRLGDAARAVRKYGRVLGGRQDLT